MSKTCKKLLASALAATMLISTFVSSLVVSAADVGTLTIGTTEITQGTTEAEVTLTYSYDPAVAAPHNLITIDSEFELTAVELVSVNGTALEDYPVEDDIIMCPVNIAQGDLEANLAAGKILLGTDVKEDNLVSEIVLAATFTVPADKEVGNYEITATSDYAGYAETEGETVAVEAGAIIVNAKVVHSAVAEWSSNDTHHWHACSVADCAEHIGETAYDYAEHNYVDGICECGAEEPVVEDAIAFVLNYDPTRSMLRAHYSYPDVGETKDVLAYAKNRGRAIKYILTIEGKEYPFAMSSIQSGRYVQVGNFGLPDTYLDATIHINVTWTNDDTTPGSWDSNKQEFNISELVAAGALEDTSNTALTVAPLGDEVVSAYNNMIAEYEALSDEDFIEITSGISVDEGYLGYTVEYFPKTTMLRVYYTYGDSFKNEVLTPAKGAGSSYRKIFYHLSVGGGNPYPFTLSTIQSGRYIQVSGFNVQDLENLSVWFHVDGLTAEQEVINVDTNAVNLNINEGIASSTSSFATAYASFIDLI